MREITLVSGLYRNIRGGVEESHQSILKEVKNSLAVNPHYRDRLVCYSDSPEMAYYLKQNGCYVHKVFDDAPRDIIWDTKHKMKHWIMYHAAKEFGDVLWIDWDTYNAKPINNAFIKHCLATNTPKFTWINNYWAIVNCAVYYLNRDFLDLMEKSFNAVVSEPNDELLWASVLPSDVRKQKDYWLNDYVVNIWTEEDFNDVTDDTLFLHLKDFSMLKSGFKQ